MYSAVTKKEHIDCMKLLLEGGANFNITDFKGNSVLMLAVRISNKPIVQLLIDWGADVNAENDDGETALYLAVTKGHVEYERKQTNEEPEGPSQIVYTLLLAGAHLHETKSVVNPGVVHKNSSKFKNQNPEILKMLSAGGASVYTADNILLVKSLQDHTRDFIRETLKLTHKQSLYYTVPQLGLPYRLQSYLLHYTLQNSNPVMSNVEKNLLLKTTERAVEFVKSLLHENVNANVQDENGMTPLMIASQNGDLDLIEQLLTMGADVNIKGLSGDTALIYATRNQQIECVHKLLRYGAKINDQGRNGDTALIHAAVLANEECLHSLIEGGADPNIKSDDGSTALIFCAIHLQCISRLIDAGADVNLKNQDGNTALIEAAEIGRVNCLKKLIKSGAELNNDKKGKTALMAAAENGHLECLKVLIQEGADLNIQNKQGMTALKLAGFDSCFNTLYKSGAEMDKLCKSRAEMDKLSQFTDREGKIV